MRAVEALRAGRVPNLLSLSVELLPLALAKARAGLNLPDEWCQRLEAAAGSKRQVPFFKHCPALVCCRWCCAAASVGWCSKE